MLYRNLGTNWVNLKYSQSPLTFSKSTMEAPEKCVKSVQIYNKDTRST